MTRHVVRRSDPRSEMVLSLALVQKNGRALPHMAELRLVVLAGGTHLLKIGNARIFRQPPIADLRPSLQLDFRMNFDKTLGFPGEGPALAVSLFPFLLCLCFILLDRRGTPLLWTSGAILGAARCAMATPLGPRNAGDRKRPGLQLGQIGTGNAPHRDAPSHPDGLPELLPGLGMVPCGRLPRASLGRPTQGRKAGAGQMEGPSASLRPGG